MALVYTDAAKRKTGVVSKKQRRRNSPDTTQQEFDAATAAARDKIYAALAQYNANYNKGVNQANLNYVTQRRAEDEALPGTLRQDLNNFAGRGMAYSSGYGSSVGAIQRNYSDRLADLLGTKAQTLSDLRSARSLYRKNASFKLEDLRRQTYLDQLAAAAKRRQKTLSLRQQIAGG